MSDSAAKAEELKTKKVFVQHVETVSSFDTTVDVVKSFVDLNSDGVCVIIKQGVKNATLLLNRRIGNKIRYCLKPDRHRRLSEKMHVLNKDGGAERETKEHHMRNYMKCVISMMLFLLMSRKDLMSCDRRS
ncbi:uncharacterized protein LOC18791162 isoform X3 [Prunus persica]|uniref:uncharacterized protein LOC18791162 isoform X3 n=1 Tax=Prunus persica TaxID=3760 RepID=UPI0009ABA7BB|nr:uncharacterized protein LOC18791162 isoform X3 [Prunus persica]